MLSRVRHVTSFAVTAAYRQGYLSGIGSRLRFRRTGDALQADAETMTWVN
jgi:hypothetical protein